MSAHPITVPIARPQLGEAEAEAAARVVRSGWLMQGKEVAAFEDQMCQATGAAHAIAVSSGTAALELSLRALGIGPGDEVITVSHSFIASAACVRSVGAKVVFADVCSDTLSLDPEAVKRLLSPRTRAIVCAHQVGFVAELPTLVSMAQAAGVPVIEDAACALGSQVRIDGQWENVGKPRGTVACFSFHPRKVITTGEGGAITTGDANLARTLRLLRQHGIEKAAPVDKPAQSPDGFEWVGTNARMTDVAAAIGRLQLGRLNEIVAERRTLAQRYCEALVDHPVLAAPVERTDTRSNWQSFPCFLRPDTRMTAAGVLRFLQAKGISGRPGLTNAHTEPAFTNAPDIFSTGPLPVSEALRAHTVFLPLFHGMTPAETEAVLAALRQLQAPQT